MQINPQMIKELREKTNAGMMDCKKALQESDSNMEKAIEVLRKKGVALASKKAGRSTKEGLISSYIHHGGKIGVLIEVNCETDFVAKNEEFLKLVKNLTLQIASAAPLYLTREDIPDEVIRKEREIFKEQIKNKPENIIDKIMDGKMEKWYKEVCLLDQMFVKPPSDKSINDIITEAIAKLGENISVKRFTRYQIGD